MIQLKNSENEILIYKSNWNYTTSGNYALELVNDLSKNIITIPFQTIVNNENYTSLRLNLSTSGSNPIVLDFYGDYTLNIYKGSDLDYSERMQYNNYYPANNPDKEIKVDKDVLIFDDSEGLNNFTIFKD